MIVSASATQIGTFLEGIAGSRGLRAAIVTGTGADSGMVDRILERGIDPGVMVVQVDLHPEVAVSLPRDFAESPCRRLVDDITLKESTLVLRSLAVALRRFGRLRPILLVVDELHMLSSPMLEEFALFLASLSDERLSILCRSSSIDPAVRCLVERYLIEEITLDERENDAIVVARYEGRPIGARAGSGELLLPVSEAPPTPGKAALEQSVERWHHSLAQREGVDRFSAARRSLVRGAQIDTARMAGAWEGPPVSIGEAPEIAEALVPSISISMLGTIAICRGDGKPAPVRGNRHSTVLGVLVIDQLLTTPLSHREFCRLASGNVDDPVRAQKIMNMGVKRLQEMLGPEAIVRKGDTPKLDLEVVSVDLLEAVRLLREAVAAAVSGPLIRAVDLLSHALDIVERGELFPGLDGEMFGAAREDFRGTLRSAVAEVARLFLEEGERRGIDLLLERVLRILPEEEDIAALLEERPVVL